MRGASLHSSNLTEWRPALCVAHIQHTSNEKVGFFTSYLYHVNAGDLVLDFVFFHSVLQLCDDGYEYSLFFDRLPAHNRHGDAAPKWAGERSPGMSPCKEQVCERHATPVQPDSVAAFHNVQLFLYPSFKMFYLV